MNPNLNTPMTREEFNAKYWFTPYQLVTLVNPKAEDYIFLVEGRRFAIKAGATEKMPGTVANIYLSQMTRIIAQDRDTLQYMSDFSLMKQYYDELIVDVEDLSQNVDTTPAYLKHVPETMRTEAVDDTPPWQQPSPVVPSTIPETNSDMTNTYATQEDLAKKGNEQADNTVEDEKEFTLGEDKYKLLIAKDDKRMYYKNGKLTSAADYNKAVSML